MAVDTIHQCPRCELRFAYLTELQDHLQSDHLPAPDDDVPASFPAVGSLDGEDPPRYSWRKVAFLET